MFLRNLKVFRVIFFILFCYFLKNKVYAQALPNPSQLSTGQGPVGTLDPNWQVSNTLFPIGSAIPNPIGLVYTPALINNNCAPGAWVNPAALPPPLNNGNWISSNTGTVCDQEAGSRYYRLTLNLPQGCNGSNIADTYIMNLDGYVDNFIDNVFVNGNPTGITGAGFWAGVNNNIVLQGMWVPGQNFVDILVRNLGGPGGLFVVANTTLGNVSVCLTSDKTSICSGESVTLTASGAETYVWSNGLGTGNSITVNPTVTTTYSVTGTVGTVTGTAEFQVVVKPSPVVNPVFLNPICSGNNTNIPLTSNPAGATFSWTSAGNALGHSAGTGNNITQTLTSLTPAFVNYTVNAQLNGCQSIVPANIFQNVQPLPVVNLGNDTIICSNDIFELDAKNIGSNYTWNTGENTQKLSVLSSGIYSVEVSNNFGCIASDEIEITVNPLPVVNLGNDITICKGDTVTLESNATGTYLWNTGQTSNSIKIANAGIYNLQVQNAQGCIGQDFIELKVNELPVINLDNNKTICNGSSHTLNAGNNGFNYAWNTGANTQEITVNQSGTYEVRVFDAIGCADTAEIEIEVKDLPVVSLGNDTTICATAFVDLDAKNPGLNYAWNTGASTQKIKVTETGTYSVNVTDEIGCLGSDAIQITVNPMPVVNLGNDTSFCKGASHILRAGNNGFNYAWSTSANTQEITVNESGTYEVRVFDAIGCADTAQIEIVVKDLPVVSLGNDTIICATAFVDLDAKNPGLNYAWNTGASTQKIKVTETGTYSVNVTDEIGCLGSDAIQITVNPMPVLNLGNDTSFCKGGSHTLNAGNNGFNYAWNTGANTQQITVNQSGTYEVRVFDAIGCADTAEIEIEVKDLPVVSLGNDTIICAIGFVDLDAKNPGLNYAWNTGASTQKIKVTETGTYSVTVTDEIGCLGSDAIQITVNPMPVVNLGNDTSFCKGASHTLNAGNNGFNYAWNTGANTQEITVNQSGTYEVRVFDAIGCADTAQIEIVVKDLPVVSLGNDTIICAIGFVDLDAKNPGLNYAWNTGASTQKIKVTETGTYSVTVTDEIGCLGSDAIQITVNPMPVVNLGNDTSFCKGASHTLNAGNNGFNYAWSTGANTQQITVNQSGTYEVRVFDAIGCADTAQIEIVVKELPVVSLGNDTIICAIGFVDLDAKNPGLNYAWNTGASTQKIKVTETGTYSVTVTDEIGCLGSDEIKITVNPMPVVNLGKDTSFCKGASHTLNAGNNGFNYAWNTGANTKQITVNQSGTYEVRVFDAIGCADIAQIEIVVKELPVVSLGNDTTICATAFVDLDAKNTGLNYAWNTGASTQKIKVTETGTYSVTVTDEIGCLGSDAIQITVNPMPVVNLGNDTSFCKGASHTLNAGNNGFNYAWSTGANTQEITVNQSGTYEVRVFDAIGCADSAQIEIVVKELPVVSLGNDTTICATAFVDLDAKNPGLNYAWNTGASTQKIKVTETGTYSVNVTDEIGCLGTDNIVITKEIIEDPYPDKDIIFCLGTTVTLKPSFTNNYNIYWESDKNNSEITVEESGTYLSYVETVFCIDTFAIHVLKVDTPMVVITDINGRDFYCFDIETTNLSIKSEENDLIFNWDDFGRSELVEITKPGTYRVTVSNEHCSSRFEKEIVEYCTGILFIPNAFSPGKKDNINDVFKPIVNNRINDYELKVYNRWGEIIFKTNDVNEGWDGTINGKICQVDVYVYHIDYSYNSEFGGSFRKKMTGTFTLVK